MSMTVGELVAYLRVDDAKFHAQVDSAKTKFGSLGSAVSSTAAKMASGAMAAGAGLWLTQSVQKADAAEVSMARLKTSVEAVGGTWTNYTRVMQPVIDKTSQLSAYSGGQLKGALTVLTQVTGNAARGLTLLGLATDLARAKNMDLETAAKLVGKVAMGNTTSLARYGIVLEKGATATQALAAMQARFGGQAKAYGDTSAGAIDKFHNAMTKLQVTVGTTLLPALTSVAKFASDILAKFQNLPGPLQKVIIGVAGITAAGLLMAPWIKTIGSAVKGVSSLAKGIRGASDASTALNGASKIGIGTLGLYAAAAAAVAVAGIAIYKAYKQATDAVAALNKQASEAQANEYGTGPAAKHLAAQVAHIRQLIASGRQISAAQQALLNEYDTGRSTIAGYKASGTSKDGNLSQALQQAFANLGIRFHSSGTNHFTNGAELMVAGERGREHVQITPEGQSSGGASIVVNIGNLHGTDERAAREFADKVGRQIMNGVRRNLVGRHA